MKKFILGIIVGGIIFGTSIYAATTYYYAATEVSYTPGDTTWNVSTVKAALDDLKSTSGTALTDLKNTNIAKAVSANGSTLSSVISTLGGIANKGSLTKTINPGGSVDIAAGYYSGGKITANSNTGTYTPSSHGTALDMGATNTYRYVNTTNVWNQAVAAADARVNTSSTNYQSGYNNGYSDGKKTSSYGLIGTYNYVAYLNVSAYGATSVSKFFAVPTQTTQYDVPSTWTNGDVKNYYGMGWIRTSVFYTPPSLQLSGSTLILTPAKLGGASSSNHASADRSDTYLATSVYYIG